MTGQLVDVPPIIGQVVDAPPMIGVYPVTLSATSQHCQLLVADNHNATQSQAPRRLHI